MENSFGQMAVKADTPELLIALEQAGGRSARFNDLDSLVQSLLQRSLSGDPVIVIERGRERHTASIVGLTKAQRTLVDDSFTLAIQQERGAWFLPEQATLDLGWINLPA